MQKNAPRAAPRADISIHDHAPEIEGLLSIVGGKLTTHRELAEQTVDALFRKLGRKSPHSQTARVPLPGASVENFKEFTESFISDSGLCETTARRLLRIYGTRASSVLNLAAEHASLKEPFDAESGAIVAEVLFSFRDEMVETLSDCLMRRTMVGFGRKLGLAAASPAASVARKHLGWDERRAARETAAYHEYVERLGCGG
ncbi:MAG TPA: glycerol-3-phosphate dehydrogenase C-terminal domain-containing protein [Pyrinomonadaceae bacterium]|nr:glycerol-3-phosphate dehydrogenase C-terminal domain-containing protein [Pyrinomonadaceae bacterium]